MSGLDNRNAPVRLTIGEIATIAVVLVLSWLSGASWAWVMM
ncbi:hypothetical protein ACQEPB_00315 [Novosphingobium fluoreni]